MLQILNYSVIEDGPVEKYKEQRPKAKRDFLLGDYLIDGRPVPDFIPDRAKVAVERSMMMTLRNGGLARREQAAAEALRRLRAAKKRLNMLQRGRPSGPSLEENTEQFVRKVKDAILAITAQGRRVTLSTVAEQMGRVERTLRRHFNDFGFSSWAALKRACQP